MGCNSARTPSGVKSGIGMLRFSDVLVSSFVISEIELPDGSAFGELWLFGYIWLKAQCGIKVRYHAVLRGGQIVSHDTFDPSAPSSFSNGIEHGHLHVALQHAAAHEPKIHVQRIQLPSAQHDRDQPVVSEAIAKFAIESD